MRLWVALIAAVAALCALGVNALNPYCKDEPTGLYYVKIPFDIQMSCGRQPNATDMRLWVEGNLTQFLSIRCIPQTKDFTCEDMPEFDFGHNGTIKEFEFKHCPMSFASVACMERRLAVSEVLKLTVVLPLGRTQVLREDAERLQGPKWISINGIYDLEMTITSDVLAPLSALEKLELSWSQLQLAPGALAGLRALTHLNLNHTYLIDSDLKPGVLANLPSLTHLSLHDNAIQNIRYDMFQNTYEDAENWMSTRNNYRPWILKDSSMNGTQSEFKLERKSRSSIRHHDSKSVKTKSKLAVTPYDDPQELSITAQLYKQIREKPSLVSLRPPIERKMRLQNVKISETDAFPRSDAIELISRFEDMAVDS